MPKQLVIGVDARRQFCGGRLSLFDQIVRGFLQASTGCQKSGLRAVLNYLDNAVMIDSVLTTRRAVVLAVEDLQQHIEAPEELQGEVRAKIILLKLEPFPPLKLYSDIATAILRIDAALRLTMKSHLWMLSAAEESYTEHWPRLRREDAQGPVMQQAAKHS